MKHLLIQADARRIPLADRSVHCVVTSPPYWGLRDYGTATWQGGDPACDHSMVRRNHGAEKQASSLGTSRDPIRASDCRCGAHRIDAQLGLEPTPEAFVANMVAVFREVRRVLHDAGSVWMNIGDTYNAYNGGAGPSSSMSQGTQTTERPKLATGFGLNCKSLKPKDLIGIPWRTAIALQADGWYLRSAITWCKTSPMPESVTDRPTSATEMLFLLTKSERYFYDADAVRVPSSQATLSRDKYTRVTTGKDGPYSVQHDHETPSHPGGRNLWNYWVLPSESYAGAHFATFPRKLVEPCIRAGTSGKGCCPECSAPWERVTETDYVDNPGHKWGGIGDGSRNPATRTDLPKVSRLPIKSTLGWRPTCSCPAAEPAPCIVFDPFAGSGTTLVVAEALGRVGIGCDLSADYLAQARRRIERPHQPVTKQREQAHPLFAHMEDA